MTSPAMAAEVAENLERICVLSSKVDVRGFLGGALSRENHFQVMAMGGGREAFEALTAVSAERTNLLIVDWEMEDMPAWVFLQRLRNTPRYDGFEVILWASGMTEQDRFLLSELDIQHILPREGLSAAAVIERVKRVSEESAHLTGYRENLRDIRRELRRDDEEKVGKILETPGLLDLIKKSPRLFHLWPEYLILSRRPEMAVDEIQAFLKSREVGVDETMKILSTLGRALCFCKRFDEALVVYERLAKKSPRNLSHATRLGDALLGLDKIDRAREKYLEVLKTDDGYPDAVLGMGKAALAQGNSAEAAAFFDRLDMPIESYALASYFNNTGVALVRSGKLQEGLAFYKTALQYLNRYRSHVLFNMGVAYLRCDEQKLASECFSEVIKIGDVSFISRKPLLKGFKQKGGELFVSNVSSRIMKSPL